MRLFFLCFLVCARGPKNQNQYTTTGICMLAVAGYLLNAGGVRLPGLISYDGTKFADIPAGVAALDAMPAAGIAQIVGFIGLLELAVMKDITGGEFVGDFRNDYIDFGWYVLLFVLGSQRVVVVVVDETQRGAEVDSRKGSHLTFFLFFQQQGHV
jgi:hypothetical protein